MNRFTIHTQNKPPRKILSVKPSKYEAPEAIHDNKKYWGKVFQSLNSTQKGPIEKQEVSMLSETLPHDLFNRVCNILNIEVSSTGTKKEVKAKDEHMLSKKPFLSRRKTIDVDRELQSDTEVEISDSGEDADKGLNIYQEFLRKPIRDQITWDSHYLEPEKEDEKSLVKKADDLTDRIAQEFCDYMKELGGDQQSQLFTSKAIKELFQIEFDTHVARSLRVVPVELPTVNEKVATVTGNIEKSRYAVLDRQITKDINAERRKDHVRCFGRSLPSREQWRTPRNNTRAQWRAARHVPRDLVTLKTVWEGITNLRSVKEYCRWMIDHPEYRRAPYLNSLGMFDQGVLDARLTFELQQDPTPSVIHTDIPAPIAHIRKRLSNITDQNQ